MSLDIAPLRTAITARYPELSASTYTVLAGGWGSIALDVDDRWIFKFPRSSAIADALRNEARLLRNIRPSISIALPELAIDEGPPFFSRHPKLPGAPLNAALYETLAASARETLAETLAQFFAEMHRFEVTRMDGLGARRLAALLPSDVILQRVWPLLPTELRRYAERTLIAWRHASTDPYGLVFGYFDGHGGNLAFDYEAQTLRGIYDFGDAGIGPLHHEFIHPSWLGADFVTRIIGAYERMTKRNLDRERITMLTGVLRLSKLAEYANDAQRSAEMLWGVTQWATTCL